MEPINVQLVPGKLALHASLGETVSAVMLSGDDFKCNFGRNQVLEAGAHFLARLAADVGAVGMLPRQITLSAPITGYRYRSKALFMGEAIVLVIAEFV